MKEASRQLGISYNTLILRAKQLDVYQPNPAGRGIKKKMPYVHDLESILVKASSFQTYKLKKRLLKAGLLAYLCSSCGLSTWLDQPIPLELDHINGDSRDHRLENLRLLCPNCHAFTETYRAKKRKSQSGVMVATQHLNCCFRKEVRVRVPPLVRHDKARLLTTGSGLFL